MRTGTGDRGNIQNNAHISLAPLLIRAYILKNSVVPGPGLLILYFLSIKKSSKIIALFCYIRNAAYSGIEITSSVCPKFFCEKRIA